MQPRRIWTPLVTVISTVLGLPTYVFASPAPLWGQCGGIGFTGPTVCDSGAICVYENPYFSNCFAAYLFSLFVCTNGDSYTATGFSVTGTAPYVNNPIGNPVFPGTTFTGGENWMGYLTGTYNNSLVFTYNYASSGATIDANLVPQHSSAVQSMTEQVNTFLNTVGGPENVETRWSSGTGLFSIWIGVNDIANTFTNPGDRGAFSDILLSAEFALVQKLYNIGARNFLWANVPPIDRTPLMMAESLQNQTLEKAIIEDFNNKLIAKIEEFQANNTGVTTFLWDTNTQFNTILNSPTAYGFKDSISFGSASNEFWGNNFHPSTFAHKLLGQQVGRVVLNGTYW